MIHFRIKAALFVILFLSCIAVLDYPFLARIYNDRISGTVMEAYENRIGSLDDTGRRIQEAEAFNELLRDGFCSMADPVSFLSETGSDPASVCRRLLCPDDSGTAGYIEIPSINLRLPLYPDVSDESLEKGACILPGSSLPVGGAGTHCCISGHSGLPERTMFTNLDLIKKGDLIRLHVLGLSLAYEMVSSHSDYLYALRHQFPPSLYSCPPCKGGRRYSPAFLRQNGRSACILAEEELVDDCDGISFYSDGCPYGSLSWKAPGGEIHGMIP